MCLSLEGIWQPKFHKEHVISKQLTIPGLLLRRCSLWLPFHKKLKKEGNKKNNKVAPKQHLQETNDCSPVPKHATTCDNQYLPPMKIS